MEHIGDRVRQLRVGRGLNMSELARRSGLTPTGVHLIEQGKRTPSSATLEKIAQGLNVNPGDLFPQETEFPLVQAR
jgi:transcriptional regulator with XRE-family HTH domain